LKVLKSILFLLFYLAINTNGYSQKYSLIISSKDSVENNILKNINFETNKLTKSQFKKNLEYNFPFLKEISVSVDGQTL